jgi:hypothetical protein
MSDDLRKFAWSAAEEWDWTTPGRGPNEALVDLIERTCRAAVEAEREACAQIADSFRCGCCGMDDKAAAAIRSRKPR